MLWGALNEMEVPWGDSWDFDSKSILAGSNKTTNPEQNKSVRKSYMLMGHPACSLGPHSLCKDRQPGRDTETLAWFIKKIYIYKINKQVNNAASQPCRSGLASTCATQHFRGQIMLQMLPRGLPVCYICVTISLENTSLQVVLFSCWICQFWNAKGGYRIQL